MKNILLIFAFIGFYAIQVQAQAGCTDPNAHNYDPNATTSDGSCETCFDLTQNGDETGIDCGGANPSCPACPVPGCMDVNAHNYDPNATVDDGSCATCSDGIQNGDEMGVDCGGVNPFCAACPLIFNLHVEENAIISGVLGVGTNDPGSKLEVAGGTQNHDLGDNYIANIHGYQQSGLYVQSTFNQGGEIARFSEIGTGFVDVPRMVIRNGGRVGINTTAPTSTLHVNGVVTIGSIEAISDQGGYVLGFNSTLIPTVDNLDDLGSSSNRWDEVWATDGTINTSDVRLKNNIQALNYGIQDIMQLRPVTYNWDREGYENKTRIGFIAQELQQVVEEVVRTENYEIVDEETGQREWKAIPNLGVAYSELIPVLVAGMQEQQEIIEALNQRFLTDSQEIEALKNELAQIKQLLISNEIQTAKNNKY